MKTFALMLLLTTVTTPVFARDVNSCLSVFVHEDARKSVLTARDNVSAKVLGQSDLVDKAFIALLSGGNILLNGPTGIAKTRLVNTLARQFDGEFKKEQFTVDTSPTDLKGQEIFDNKTDTYKFLKGILFGNFILIDEINRAQPKTQNATLSAMEEHEVSINGTPKELPDVYFIIATQNPETQSGTYPLPEAQLDRFLFRIDIDYTDMETERQISRMAMAEMAAKHSAKPEVQTSPYSLDVIRDARKDVLKVPVSDAAENYILAMVDATRNPHDYDSGRQVGKYIKTGVGPRATIGLHIASKAAAYLHGHSSVTIEDVDFIAHDVLRHRLKLNDDAGFQQISTDTIITQIQALVKTKLGL